MSESSTSSVWSPRVRVYVPDARSAELKTNDWHSLSSVQVKSTSPSASVTVNSEPAAAVEAKLCSTLYCVELSEKPTAMPTAPAATIVPPVICAVESLSPMSSAPLPPLVGPLTITVPPLITKLPLESSPSPEALTFSVPPEIPRI